MSGQPVQTPIHCMLDFVAQGEIAPLEEGWFRGDCVRSLARASDDDRDRAKGESKQTAPRRSRRTRGWESGCMHGRIRIAGCQLDWPTLPQVQAMNTSRTVP